MRLTRNAVFIHAYKHCVMVFRIIVNQPLLRKMRDNIAIDKSFLDEVGINTMHIFIGFRQAKFLWSCLCHSCFRRTLGNRCNASSQQLVHCDLKIHAVKIPHEFNCAASNLILVVKLGCAVNCYAVVFPAAVMIDQLVLPSGFL